MNHVRFHGHMHPRSFVRRAMRQADSPYRRKARRIDWLAVMLICAAAMVTATMVYKWMGP